ncbi:hypothetical protein SEA_NIEBRUSAYLOR_7 [Mycobacterium phage NiebruSaylor]|nr:hypothetical protein SEA_VORRPS_7 [Mycobacterium phage Vorrps]QFP97055.1 hypothetical protein SEA_KRILI_7 [Mycobacterium phage Krili]QOC58441.1 membrane protein [Mycobacterium phage Shida]QOC59206.1 hypothetical protein SEA_NIEBRUSAYLOR_7 [Mycobacterium phage NiebruSaylor]QXO13379.1 membrane protein [Mycobacterium phage Murai]UAW08358.1 membrane protein [Mycobacterium phage Mori]WNO28592.1 membrane protein [Mycobacterium phage MadKillah]
MIGWWAEFVLRGLAATAILTALACLGMWPL